MPGKPPPWPICCIMERILVKSLTSLPTSFSEWPEPVAMRRRRLGELESSLGVFALFLGHGVNHGFAALELGFALFQHVAGKLLAHAGNQLHDAAQGAHALHKTHLLEEIVEVEFRF